MKDNGRRARDGNTQLFLDPVLGACPMDDHRNPLRDFERRSKALQPMKIVGPDKRKKG